jgi:hypothetical protein
MKESFEVGTIAADDLDQDVVAAGALTEESDLRPGVGFKNYV